MTATKILLFAIAGWILLRAATVKTETDNKYKPEKYIEKVRNSKHIYCANICCDSETCEYHKQNKEPHLGELPAYFKGTPYCPDFDDYMNGTGQWEKTNE